MTLGEGTTVGFQQCCPSFCPPPPQLLCHKNHTCKNYLLVCLKAFYSLQIQYELTKHCKLNLRSLKKKKSLFVFCICPPTQSMLHTGVKVQHHVLHETTSNKVWGPISIYHLEISLHLAQTSTLTQEINFLYKVSVQTAQTDMQVKVHHFSSK